MRIIFPSENGRLAIMSVYDRRSVSTCCIYNPGDSSTWSKPMNDEKIASYGNQLKGTLWTS